MKANEPTRTIRRIKVFDLVLHAVTLPLNDHDFSVVQETALNTFQSVANCKPL
jgi:hypothetical protein